MLDMYKKIKIEFVEASHVKFLDDGTTELKAVCRSYDPEYFDGFEENPMASYNNISVPIVLPDGVEVNKENIEDAILAKDGYTQTY